VTILTTFDDEEYIFEGLRAEARGYQLKDIRSEALANGLEGPYTICDGLGVRINLKNQ